MDVFLDRAWRLPAGFRRAPEVNMFVGEGEARVTGEIQRELALY